MVSPNLYQKKSYLAIENPRSKTKRESLRKKNIFMKIYKL